MDRYVYIPMCIFFVNLLACLNPACSSAGLHTILACQSCMVYGIHKGGRAGVVSCALVVQ